MAESTITEVASATTSQARPPSVSAMIRTSLRPFATINQKLFEDSGQPTKVVSLGETQVPEDIMMELLKDISEKYTERTYHVFTNNGNTFTDEVAQLVTGEGIPREYSQLPREFYQTQLGQQIAPMMVNMQKSLTLAANQLFNNDEQALPLRVRQAGQEEEREGQQQ